jgi:hypothetical protein
MIEAKKTKRWKTLIDFIGRIQKVWLPFSRCTFGNFDDILSVKISIADELLSSGIFFPEKREQKLGILSKNA